MAKTKSKKKSKEKQPLSIVNKESAKADLDKVRLELLKDFGSNSVVLGTDLEKLTYGRIETGSISLDIALGGGIPVGKATQISGAKSCGKTTISSHIAKHAQKKQIDWVWTQRQNEKGKEVITQHQKYVDGLICAYVDAEGTQDEKWLKQIGVDTSNWLYNKPSGLEEALNIAHAMQLKGVNLVIIDSVDALEPTLYYETNSGDSARMGEKQKMIGEYLRKYTTTNNRLEREGKLPCTLILLNQLREKIGCFHYTSPVLLENGKTEMIGKIVNNKMPVKVMSYNETTGKIEPKQIVNWFDNGVNHDEFITILTDSPQGDEKSYLACTPNHKILTPQGYKEARNIKEGDFIVQSLKARPFSKVQNAMPTSSVLSDGDNLLAEPIDSEYITKLAKVCKVGTRPKDEYTHRYDIEVEGNHNYLVNNLIVHNCYGDPEYTPGGRSIGFYISIDLRLKRGDWITIGTKEDKQILGQVIKFKTHKNKTYRQQQTGECDFYFDTTERVQAGHVDNSKEIVKEGILWGVIEKAGSWFRYKGDNIAQGADNTVNEVLQNPELFNNIKKDLFDLVREDTVGMDSVEENITEV